MVKRENGIYWNDQKDDMDGNTIPTPYIHQLFAFFISNAVNGSSFTKKRIAYMRTIDMMSLSEREIGSVSR